MYKLIAVLLFVLAISKAEGQGVGLYVNSSILHTDTYIDLNRQQHVMNLQDYDNQINIFKETYSASLKTIEIQLDMLVDTLTQTSERLNPLEALSSFSRNCVKKYRPNIPTVASVKSSVNNCINTASNQLSSMLSGPLATRSYLASYYENTFEKSVATCKSKFGTEVLYLNYTLCAVEAVDAAQSYTSANQKTFATQMTAARCTADANTNQALDCSYVVENNTISLLSEANLLIKKCLSGEDDCKQCSAGYSCPYMTYMKKDNVDYRAGTMANPFYGRSELKDCIMIKLY